MTKHRGRGGAVSFTVQSGELRGVVPKPLGVDWYWSVGQLVTGRKEKKNHDRHLKKRTGEDTQMSR